MPLFVLNVSMRAAQFWARLQKSGFQMSLMDAIFTNVTYASESSDPILTLQAISMENGTKVPKAAVYLGFFL